MTMDLLQQVTLTDDEWENVPSVVAALAKRLNKNVRIS